ncbi:VOC family protein [Ideonella sp. A 288]|uniref:VOC family protein n=1 Tax=Ideonella sp. A 288 TaxID=1962181 RepID=UPI000B4AA35C|nr:VOC family protein [Ideonella sp. A 288]
MNAEIDHLVVVADSLAQGAAWCEATFGVAPGPGGRHPLMGTHNRLLAIGSDAFPRSYLEVIAIDPDAPDPGRVRWFGMDEPALRAAVRAAPRLVHTVARTSNIEMLRWGLVNVGIDPGVPLAAERDTPRGKLAWRIAVRDDGAVDREGALPTLIEWRGVHPTEGMPASPVQLTAVTAGGLSARAAAVLRLRGVEVSPEPLPRWQATLQSPAGPVTLTAWPDPPTR